MTTLSRPRTFTLERRGETISCTSDLTMEQAAKLLKGSPSSFAQDLISAWARHRISPKQELWLVFLAQEQLDRQQGKAAASGRYLPLVQAVQRLQENAKGRVALRFIGATVSAVTQGQNTGCLYVKTAAGEYAGKILSSGEFRSAWGFHPEALAEVQAALEAALADPEGAAVAYGRETGKCSCCGRTLTNQVSIDLGIGPICLDKLGGAWG